MSMKPNYFKIGVFVIVATSLIVAAVVVFGAGIFGEEKIYYETYFDESVSGLNPGAAVEFRGVRLGQIEKVAFIAEEYEIIGDPSLVSKYERYVMVLCSMPRGNLPEFSYEQRATRLKQMVSAGLRVRLASNLLTGQAYLQADYIDPDRFPVPEINWQPKHLYVPSAPSTFTTLKGSVDKVLYKLQEIDIDKVVKAVDKLLVSLDKAVADADLEGISQEAKALLAETRETNQHLKKLLASSKPETEHANLPETIARLNKTLARIDKLIASEKPEIEIILANFREVSENVKNLTESLKQHPSELIFSQPPPKSEILK